MAELNLNKDIQLKIDKLVKARELALTDENKREYLGFSLIGHECDRFIWLKFRWAVNEEIPGRVYRIFETGHIEEERMSKYLKDIGLDLKHIGEEQLTLRYSPWVLGHPDGIIFSGVPGAEKSTHIWECKTANNRSFTGYEKHGVQNHKQEYYIQVQANMYCSNKCDEQKMAKINRCCFTVKNKNDESIYHERIKLDKALAERFLERADSLVYADELPPGLSDKPTYFKCKMCSMWEFCHGNKCSKEVNCRTCNNSYAEKDGTYRCALYKNKAIPFDFQKKGCDNHVFKPSLVNWARVPSLDTEFSLGYIVEGKYVVNGKDGNSSLNILDGKITKVDLIKDTFGAVEIE